MSKRLQNLYRISEFASLCGVTKHTLYHYDEIGLLRPCVIQDNGYRYYTMEQFSIFSIISILKKAGTPLEEIKEYLSKRDNQTFIKVLNQKLAELNKEAEAIKKMCHILSSTIAEVERSMDIKIGEMQFIECNEEYLMITASPIRSGSSRQAMFSCFSQHFQYCEEHSIEVGWHIGEIVLQSDIANGCYKEGFYFSRLPSPIDDKRFFIKPKGTYAVMYYQGNSDNLEIIYHENVQKLEALGYQIAGNIYEEDVIDYLSERDPDNYIYKIEVQVEKDFCQTI